MRRRSAPKKPPSYHHGDLRRALLDAALAIIEKEGLGALSQREAARRAGVSPAAPYHHFENRAAMLGAIAVEGFARMGAMMEEAEAEAMDVPGERFRALGRAYVSFALAHPAHFRVMFRPELQAGEPTELVAELERVGKPTFEKLVQSVAEAQATGEAPQGDPRPLILLAWSSVHGLASLMLDGPLGQGFPGLDLEPKELAFVLVEHIARTWSRAARAEAMDTRRQRR
jgi:AcrR family transcriptional regulator